MRAASEPSSTTLDLIRAVAAAVSPRSIVGMCMGERCRIVQVAQDLRIPLLRRPEESADECLVYIGTHEDGSESVRMLLKATFRRAPGATVVIDGFAAPDAAASGQSQPAHVHDRTVRLLWDIVPAGHRIYFPALTHASGAAGECCILAPAGPLEHVQILRGGDYHDWLRLHRATESIQASHLAAPQNDRRAYASAGAVESLQREIEATVHAAAQDRASLRKQLDEKEAVIRELKTALDAEHDAQRKAVTLNDDLIAKERVIAELTAAVEAYRASRVPLFGRLWNAAARARAALRRRIGFTPKLGVLAQHPPRPLRIPPLPRTSPRSDLPEISLVTPSFRHGRFLERTLLSVLAQRYPRLEYVVQDGGSDDGTTDILRSYGSRLARWASERDSGQSQAINRGFASTSGEVMGWLNSDDLLMPAALRRVGELFREHPDVDVVYGNRLIIDDRDMQIGRWILPGHDSEVLSWADYVPQETLFWRRRVWDRIGGRVDESFRFAMDWDLLVRMRDAGAKFMHIPQLMGAFRVHPEQKTSDALRSSGALEMNRIRSRIHGRVPDQPEIDRHVHTFLRRHIRADAVHAMYRSATGLMWRPALRECGIEP